MKKINYSNITDINDRYLACVYSESLQKQWKKLFDVLNRNHPDIYPENVSDILIANFETLTKYYNDSPNLTEEEKIAAKRVFNYDSAKSKLKPINKQSPLSKILKSSKYSKIIANFFKDNSSDLKITTCYYCEMSYVFSYKANVYDKSSKKFIEKDKRMFDLDHFFEKADCPITALSLYNFIPSCQVCNSRIKGQKGLNTLYRLKTDRNNLNIKNFSEISPSSQQYDFDNEVKITIQINEDKQTEEESHIGFISNLDKNKVEFKTDNEACLRAISAFNLIDRYNYSLVKKEALYLEELKQKYILSHREEIEDFFRKQGEIKTSGMIYDIIFNYYNDEDSIFSKMRRDILFR